MMRLAFLALAVTGAVMLAAGVTGAIHVASIAGVAMFGAGLGLWLEAS